MQESFPFGLSSVISKASVATLSMYFCAGKKV